MLEELFYLIGAYSMWSCVPWLVIPVIPRWYMVKFTDHMTSEWMPIKVLFWPLIAYRTYREVTIQRVADKLNGIDDIINREMDAFDRSIALEMARLQTSVNKISTKSAKERGSKN